jgi:hypothetical protein
MRNAYRILVVKQLGKQPLEKQARSDELMVDLMQMSCEDVMWKNWLQITSKWGGGGGGGLILFVKNKRFMKQKW